MNPVRMVNPPVFYLIFMHPVGWRLLEVGGEEGIRTLGSDESPVFKTGSLNHSDTSPSTRLLYLFSPSLSTLFCEYFLTNSDENCKLFRRFLPLTLPCFTHCKVPFFHIFVENPVEKVEESHHFGVFFWGYMGFSSPNCGKLNLFFDNLLNALYGTSTHFVWRDVKKCTQRSTESFDVPQSAFSPLLR